MTQQQSPFIGVKYGWGYGEDNWNDGMDENLVKFSFMFDGNVDQITNTLPASPAQGHALFNTTDNKFYYFVNSFWYNSPCPKNFIFKIKSTGDFYQFNGTSPLKIDNPSEIESRLDSVELTLSSLGTAAFEDSGYFAKDSDLIAAKAEAKNYTDALKSDLANTSDVQKGTALVAKSLQNVNSIASLKTILKTSPSQMANVLGYYTPGDGGGGIYYLDSADTTSSDNGGTIIVAADGARWKLVNDGKISLAQFGAKGDGVSNDGPAITSAVSALSGLPIYVTRTPAGGQYAITSGSVDLSGVIFIYEPGTRVFAQGGVITNQPNFYSLFAGNNNSAGRTSRSHGSIQELRDVLTGIAYGSGADTYAINRIRIYNDRLDAVSDPASGTKVDGLLVHQSFGGSGTKGGRHSIEGILDQTGTTDSDNTDRNYAAVVGLARTSTGDGGALGDEKGAYFGGNFYGSLTNGAMNCYNVTACEFNVAISSGASAKYRSGIQVVGGGASRGTETDAAISVSNLGGASAFWKDGILFGRQNGQPCFNSTSNVITVNQETLDRVINLETVGTVNHLIYHPTVKMTPSFLDITAQSPSVRLGASGVANTPFIRFRSGATTAPGYDTQMLASGGTGSDGAGTLTLTGSTVAVSGIIRPTVDNTSSLGTTSFRFSVVYAGTGTINTSDLHEKQDIRAISEAEARVAAKLKTLIKAFRFRDAVKQKGDDARIHFGVIAQEVKDAFEKEGLDPFRYALLCRDEWEACEEVAVNEYDEEGNVTGSSVAQPAREAGSRYGIRYDELMAFIISSL